MRRSIAGFSFFDTKSFESVKTCVVCTVTKSVSRLARNAVDSLVAVRKIKGKGVEVYFQKENIYMLDSKGELLITIMSSLARKRVAASWKTSHGDAANASRMARSPCLTKTSSAAARARMARWRSCRKKRRWRGASSACFSKARRPWHQENIGNKSYPHAHREANVADGDHFKHPHQ